MKWRFDTLSYRNAAFVSVVACSLLLSGPFPVTAAPVVTTKNVLVILWDPHRPTDPAPSKASIQRLFSTKAPSIPHYIATESNGRARLRVVGILGWFNAKNKNGNSYWENDPNDLDKDGFTSAFIGKWAEAVRFADPLFNFKSYDKNKDGTLDPITELGVVIFIPQNSAFGTNRPPSGAEVPAWKPLTVDGVTIPTIAEVYAGSPPNFGVATHELSHLIFGMPDMYANNQYRPGAYSLMDGSYGDYQYDAWNKLRLGWLETFTPKRSGRYYLRSVEDGHAVMRINRPGTKEFFLVENRQHGVYDKNIPDTGIAIWNIIDPGTSGDWGRTNIRLLRAHGGNVSDADALWSGTPASPATTGELLWSDGTPSGVQINNISSSAKVMWVDVVVP